MVEFFETISIKEGVAQHMPLHQWRFEQTLLAFAKTPHANLASLLNPPKEPHLRCKIIYNLDQILSISYFAYQKRKIKKIKVLHDDQIEYGFKATDRSGIDALFDQKGECDEILIVKNKRLTETSIANIALFYNGMWTTPKSPLHRGTTRERLLREGSLKEIDLTLEHLLESDRIAMMNAMIGFDILTDVAFVF